MSKEVIRLKVIGLTGGIASGKSTVLKWFEDKNVFVIDADKVNHDLLNNNSKVINKIAEVFGQRVINNGKIDKERLGELVFSDNVQRQLLENILHPLIYKQIKNTIEMNLSEPLIVLDIPLLFETNFDNLCDITIVVYATKEIQIHRLMKRNQMSKIDAIKRIDSQMSMDEKAKLATYIIDNTKTIDQTIDQFENIYKKILLGV